MTVNPRSATSTVYFYLLILALCGFVTSFGAHIVATNLPSYAEKVGAGAFMIGLLIAVYDFAELFAKPLAGFVADKRGMKLMLLVGLIIFIIGSLLFLIIHPKLLLLVRFIQGLGAAALSTVSITLVAKFFPKGRGRAFGIYNAIKGAGYVIAPVIGGWLAHRYGFGMIFVVSAGVGIAALLASCFLPRDQNQKADLEDAELSLKEFFLIFKEPRLLPIYAVIVINMFMVGILFGFLPVYLHSIGYTALQSGSVISAATLSYLLVQPLAGHLADKIEIRFTVLFGLLLAAAAIIATTFTSGGMLLAVVIVAGLGIGNGLDEQRYFGKYAGGQKTVRREHRGCAIVQRIRRHDWPAARRLDYTILRRSSGFCELWRAGPSVSYPPCSFAHATQIQPNHLLSSQKIFK